MKKCLSAAVPILLAFGTIAHAHRLDEYLEATIISLDGNRVHAEIRLTPGVSVASVVIGEIDANRDGVISAAEQQAYAHKVLGDLSLAVDGNPIRPHLVSLRFPAIEDMKEGTGEIELDFDSTLPPRGGSRKLTFENHHEFPIAAYLVNCLVPQDPGVRIVSQSRNYLQSSYQLDFVDRSAGGSAKSLARLWQPGEPVGTVAVLLLAGIALLWRRRPRPVRAVPQSASLPR
jgi:hypothetical protein